MNAPRKGSLPELLTLIKKMEEENTWTGYEAVRIPHFEEVLDALKEKTVDANDKKLEKMAKLIKELEAKELTEVQQEELEAKKEKLKALHSFNQGLLAGLTQLKIVIRSGTLQDNELATRTEMPEYIRQGMQPYFDRADAMMDAEVAAYHSQQESAKKVADEAIEKARNGEQ